jgi:hypothetical protein
MEPGALYKATRDAYVAAGACPQLARSRGGTHGRTSAPRLLSAYAATCVSFCAHVRVPATPRKTPSA